MSNRKRNRQKSDNKGMRNLLLILTLIIGLLVSIPIIIYLPGELIRIWNRVHVKDKFYIEYLEMYASISLWNGTQGFVGNVEEAYWNKDSLVVLGDGGCFLIEFGKTKYNDEMVEIECSRLNQILKNGAIEEFIKKE